MSSKEVTTRFPFINLEKALARAEVLHKSNPSGKPMAVATVFEVWEYSAKSSGGFQTIAALKMYGLIGDDGTNEDRKIQLTDNARRYFLDERDDVRSGMLSDFALHPKLFSALWESDGWSAGLPADTVARSHLKIERGLNEQSARSLLSVFKDNMKYSGLKAGIQAEASVESHYEQEVSDPEQNTERDAPMRENAPIPPDDRKREPNPPLTNKPIMFDMETVSGSYSFDNADDLQDFIDKLEKIKGLMPTKH